MKHHDALRPIGKCKGCPLNFKTRCAAALAPKAQWDRGRCKHYGDKALLEEVLSKPVPGGAKRARRIRQAKAIAKATGPHYNGVLDPGKMAGRVRRSKR
jgi:hypothetical protein